MTEINTESKVTKLSSNVDTSCVAQEKMHTCESINNSNISDESAVESNKAKEKIMLIKDKAVFSLKKVGSLIKSVSMNAVSSARRLLGRASSAICSLPFKSFFMTFKEKLGAASKVLFSETGIKVFIVGGLAAISVLICTFTCSIGYNVNVAGRSLGVIPSKQVYDEVYGDISENVFNMTGEEFQLPQEAKLSMTIALKRNFLSNEQFAENLKSVSSSMVPAYTVLIDNKMVVALPGEEMALEAIDEYKNSFSLGLKESTLEFANDVEIRYMFAPKSLLRSKDAAVTHLLNGEFSYYKSDSDLTLSELSDKTGVSSEMILKFNSIQDDLVPKGTSVKLYSGRMFADVMAVEQIQREEIIPFETIEHTSDEMYQGVKRIQTKGVDGLKNVDEYITYINGIETKRDVLHESVLKAPTAQVELVGTKEPPPSVGTGSLAMPTSGSLSSRFGSRWGRQHKGIDLSASVGTPIYAADNGKVIYSQYNDGGFGYLIQIDHGNGLKTYYAHCSELLVNAGDVVAKGDLIAKVGNTGNSTGAHLHFEVRQDDVPIDPFTYLN